MSHCPPELWATVRQLPSTRREASHVCELCGHRVLAFLVCPEVLVTVDPSRYQQLVADLVVGPARVRELPPWSWCPTFAVPHECPPPGDSPLAEQARREERMRDEGGGMKKPSDSSLNPPPSSLKRRQDDCGDGGGIP
jgi:hypothetical protein